MLAYHEKARRRYQPTSKRRPNNMSIHAKSTIKDNRLLPLLPIIPVGLTKNTTLHGACMVIFKILEENRHLPFFIDRQAYNLLESVMSDDESSQLALSQTIIEGLGYRLAYVCLSQSEAAVSETRLALLPADAADDDEPQYIACSFVEGMALGLQIGVPFYVTIGDALQFVAGESEDGRVAVPIRNMPEDVLQEAINQAVAADNFELASALRDELRRRTATANEGD